MKRTFCTVIRDSRAEEILAPMAEILGRATRWSFREIHVRRRTTKDVKREAIRRFGITARHFNGARFDLDQAVQAWRGTMSYRRQGTSNRIAAVSDDIKRIDAKLSSQGLSNRKRKSLLFRRHQKMRHLSAQHDRLRVIGDELANKVPRICFGGRKLLRRAEVDSWRDRRSGRICLVGAGCETAGNQSAQWDGAALRVRLPDAVGGRATLEGISFRYGQDEVLAAIEANAPLTWLLFRGEDGRWRAHVTVETPAAEIVTDLRCGVVGVDLNADHLAVTVADRMGNPVGRETLPFPTAGTDEGKAVAVIGESVKALVSIAKERRVPISAEKLDFSRKKAGLRETGKRHARRLSGFAYAKFFAMLEARCAREGVELIQVNPAFTSVIGRLKYAHGRAMSAHHAAALVIGRRAMGYGERFVCMLHGTLDGPGRNRPRHVWSRWRNARRRPARQGASAPDMTARSVSGTRRIGERSARASAAAVMPPGART